jgi:hypothetical protein
MKYSNLITQHHSYCYRTKFLKNQTTPSAVIATILVDNHRVIKRSLIWCEPLGQKSNRPWGLKHEQNGGQRSFTEQFSPRKLEPERWERRSWSWDRIPLPQNSHRIRFRLPPSSEPLPPSPPPRGSSQVARLQLLAPFFGC